MHIYLKTELFLLEILISLTDSGNLCKSIQTSKETKVEPSFVVNDNRQCVNNSDALHVARRNYNHPQLASDLCIHNRPTARKG